MVPPFDYNQGPAIIELDCLVGLEKRGRKMAEIRECLLMKLPADQYYLYIFVCLKSQQCSSHSHFKITYIFKTRAARCALLDIKREAKPSVVYLIKHKLRVFYSKQIYRNMFLKILFQ